MCTNNRLDKLYQVYLLHDSHLKLTKKHKSQRFGHHLTGLMSACGIGDTAAIVKPLKRGAQILLTQTIFVFTLNYFINVIICVAVVFMHLRADTIGAIEQFFFHIIKSELLIPMSQISQLPRMPIQCLENGREMANIWCP